MGVAVENILVGAGILKVGAVDADPAALVDVGATDGGVEINYSAEFYDIECDQTLTPLDTRKTKESVTIKTNLEEATLQNFAIAIGYPDAAVVEEGVAPNDTVTFEFGGDLSVNPKQVQFVGTGPNGKPRTATFYRCIAVGAVGMAFKKGDKTLIPVEFRVLADATKPDGKQLAKFVDGTPV